MSVIKKICIITLLLVIYIYACYIIFSPENYIIMEGENLEINTLFGIRLISKKDTNLQTVQTVSNINKNKVNKIGKIDYNLTGYARINYVLADDTTDVMLALETMNKYLFKYLPEDKRPMSYLLVDSIMMNIGNFAVPDDYYKAFTTTCVGNIERLRTMSDSARESFMAELAGMELVDDLLASADTNLTHQFDSAAFNVRLDASVYSPNRLPTSEFRGSSSQISTVRTLAPPEAFGLLHYRGRETNRIFYPTDNQDYAAYIGLVLRCSEEEVLEDYAQDTCVMKKYYAVRQMMREAGMIE